MFVCISSLDINHHGLGVIRVQKQPTAIAAQVVPVTIVWGAVKKSVYWNFGPSDLFFFFKEKEKY